MTGRGAHDPCFVVDSNQGVALVFGLYWTPLIGSHPRRHARQLAASQGATHYACAGEPGVALGLMQWPRRVVRPQRGIRLVAAAAAFAAQAGQGLHVEVYRLDNGRYWLVGARTGVVLSRTDRLFDDGEAAWHARADVCRTLGIDDALPPRLPELRSCLDLVDACLPSVLLHRLGPVEVAARRYRWPIAVGILLVMGGVYASWRAAAPQANPQATVAAGSQATIIDEPVIDPIQVRRTVLHEQWRGAPAMTAVFARFKRLPVRPNGWALGQARCIWEGGAWTCRAQYVRDDGRATNQALIDAIGGDWTVSFTPVDHAYLSWQDQETGHSPSVSEWPMAADVDRTWMSALQDITPLFTHLSIGAPESFELDTAAKVSGSVWPDGAPRRRAIDAQGPMRSFALWPQASHTVWTEVALTVRESTGSALTDSQLHILIRGWIHERDHAAG